MNPDDMRTLVVKIEQPQLQPEQEMVATEEAEGSYANAPEEKEVGDTHNDFSFKGFGKRKRHTRDALGNYGDNPLEESKMFTEYENFKEQKLNELWGEVGNWFKGKGYKSDEELAADEKGSGERSFKFKKGDVAKGEKMAKQKRMAAADASLDRGTQTSDFGQQQIAKRDASWDKGIDNPSTQDVARPKPPAKSYDDRIMRGLRAKQASATPVAKPQVVARPKPAGNYDDKITRGLRAKQANNDAQELAVANKAVTNARASRTSLPPGNEIRDWKKVADFKAKRMARNTPKTPSTTPGKIS
jgi:hypothetical protein